MHKRPKQLVACYVWTLLSVLKSAKDLPYKPAGKYYQRQNIKKGAIECPVIKGNGNSNLADMLPQQMYRMIWQKSAMFCAMQHMPLLLLPLNLLRLQEASRSSNLSNPIRKNKNITCPWKTAQHELSNKQGGQNFRS